MISNVHNKHAKLARPTLGAFGRREFALLGAPCGRIQELAGRIIADLSGAYKCAYVDADHAAAGEAAALPGRLASGAWSEYTDKIAFHQLQQIPAPTEFQKRQWFNEADLVLVNGNHHKAVAQVVFLDPAKENSLKKRLDQLTDVQLFLAPDASSEPYDFLKDKLPNWQQIPRLSWDDANGILAFFRDNMQANIAPVCGLVLAGGHSVRMGRDKGKIDWHGKEQRYHMADLLSGLCAEAYISCRAEQEGEIYADYAAIPDTFTGLGPYGAILSAFRTRPDAAWLVVACDLPLLDAATLSYLLEHRDPSKLATTFISPFDRMPEPLVTLWEPKSYLPLLAFLAQGYSCPRKVLLNTDIHLLRAPDDKALTNVNTPEEMMSVFGC